MKMQIQYSTLSPTAIITAAEWPEWMNLPESEKQPWLDAKWARLTSPAIEPDAAHPSTISPIKGYDAVFYDPINRRSFSTARDYLQYSVENCAIPFNECEVCQRNAAKLAVPGECTLENNPEPDADDYTPSDIDLEQNAGPCLVTICADTSGDDWNGYLGRIECWDVVADVNSPQFSEVG